MRLTLPLIWPAALEAMHTTRELRELLRAHNLRLQKRLGQNYLIDPNLTRRLIESCHLTPADTVIEIGAGLGALTEGLARAAKTVIAVEYDRKIAEVLTDLMRAHPNVEVQCADILEFDWEAHLGAAVIGTIPYQITAPILVRLCESRAPIRHVWLAIQQEVADRLTAKPGTKAYGRLSILVQYHFHARQLLRLPRAAFFPQPGVDSAWIQLTRHQQPVATVQRDDVFEAVVQVAFGQRRKTLANCLMKFPLLPMTRAEAEALLRQIGCEPAVRGETLGVAQFAALANVLSDKLLQKRASGV